MTTSLNFIEKIKKTSKSTLLKYLLGAALITAGIVLFSLTLDAPDALCLIFTGATQVAFARCDEATKKLLNHQKNRLEEKINVENRGLKLCQQFFNNHEFQLNSHELVKADNKNKQLAFLTRALTAIGEEDSDKGRTAKDLKQKLQDIYDEEQRLIYHVGKIFTIATILSVCALGIGLASPGVWIARGMHGIKMALPSVITSFVSMGHNYVKLSHARLPNNLVDQTLLEEECAITETAVEHVTEKVEAPTLEKNHNKAIIDNLLENFPIRCFPRPVSKAYPVPPILVNADDTDDETVGSSSSTKKQPEVIQPVKKLSSDYKHKDFKPFWDKLSLKNIAGKIPVISCAAAAQQTQRVSHAYTIGGH